MYEIKQSYTTDTVSLGSPKKINKNKTKIKCQNNNIIYSGQIYIGS